MSRNTQLVLILSALVVVAGALRIVRGPAPVAAYADAKLGLSPAIDLSPVRLAAK